MKKKDDFSLLSFYFLFFGHDLHMCITLLSSRWKDSLLADLEQQVDFLRIVVPWVSVHDGVDFNEVAVVLVRLWDRLHKGLRGLEG